MAAARRCCGKALERRSDSWPRRTSSWARRSRASAGTTRRSTHLRAAAAQYPRDRVVLNQLGRVLFLKRQFGEAIDEFKQVLAIDPEDLQAHYNLMLCYQGLGDAAAAERERVLYARFKADESSQAITGPYRQLHPHDNNERQQIHEHRAATARPACRHGRRAGRPTRAATMTVDAIRHRSWPSCCSWVFGTASPGYVADDRQASSRRAAAAARIRPARSSPTSRPRPASASGTTTAPSGKKYLPETLGSGVRLPRLRRRRLAGHPARQLDELARPRPVRRRYPALYRNNRNGTFTDVTTQAGLAVEMYGLGVAAADYDNDGHTDIYITASGRTGCSGTSAADASPT